jgi:hypothetical protein
MKNSRGVLMNFIKAYAILIIISCVALGAKAESLTDYIKFYNP